MIQTIQSAISYPDTINNVHESCYKSYWILNVVEEMVARGDSIETIKDIISYIRTQTKSEKSLENR